MTRDMESVNNNAKHSEGLFEKYIETRSVEIRNEIVSRHLYLADIITKVSESALIMKIFTKLLLLP